MLSGETRLSRILKGFNNIWKLLPKSWRSSSSLRYVLGATLGIRPIHLLFSSTSSLSLSFLPPPPFPLLTYYESLGRLWARGGEEARGRGPSLLPSPNLPPPSRLLPTAFINYHSADTMRARATLTFLLNQVKAARLADRAIRLGC